MSLYGRPSRTPNPDPPFPLRQIQIIRSKDVARQEVEPSTRAEHGVEGVVALFKMSRRLAADGELLLNGVGELTPEVCGVLGGRFVAGVRQPARG